MIECVMGRGFESMPLSCQVLWFGVLNDIFFPKAARPSDLALPALGRLVGQADEEWVKDFENGSRGAPPNEVMAAAVPLFFVGGVVIPWRQQRFLTLCF